MLFGGGRGDYNGVLFGGRGDLEWCVIWGRDLKWFGGEGVTWCGVWMGNGVTGMAWCLGGDICLVHISHCLLQSGLE